MGIRSEESCTKITTLDNHTVTNMFHSRDQAFQFLLEHTTNILYKEASIFDYNTGTIVLSLRSIK
jgi:hypothetical protein